MLMRNQSLEALSLRDDSIGVEAALNLVETLKHNTSLQVLELSPKCKPPSFPGLYPLSLQERVSFSMIPIS